MVLFKYINQRKGQAMPLKVVSFSSNKSLRGAKTSGPTPIHVRLLLRSPNFELPQLPAIVCQSVSGRRSIPSDVSCPRRHADGLSCLRYYQPSVQGIHICPLSILWWLWLANHFAELRVFQCEFHFLSSLNLFTLLLPVVVTVKM